MLNVDHTRADVASNMRRSEWNVHLLGYHDVFKYKQPDMFTWPAGGFHKRDQRRQLAETADVVVGTPGRLGELCKMGHLGLDKCQAVVLDEADVLLGQASMFEEQVGF